MMEYEASRLDAIISNKQSKVIDAIVASIAKQAIKKGDNIRMDFLLNRTIGKVPQPLEHSGKDGGPIETAELTPKERKEKIKELLKLRQELELE